MVLFVVLVDFLVGLYESWRPKRCSLLTEMLGEVPFFGRASSASTREFGGSGAAARSRGRLKLKSLDGFWFGPRVNPQVKQPASTVFLFN